MRLTTLTLALTLVSSVAFAAGNVSTGSGTDSSSAVERSRQISGQDSATVQKNSGVNDNDTTTHGNSKSTTKNNTVGNQKANTTTDTDTRGTSDATSADASSFLLKLYANLEAGKPIGKGALVSEYFQECAYLQQKPLVGWTAYPAGNRDSTPVKMVQQIADKGPCAVAYGLVAKESLLKASVSTLSSPPEAITEALVSVLTDDALMGKLGAIVGRVICDPVVNKAPYENLVSKTGGRVERISGSLGEGVPLTIQRISCATELGQVLISPEDWSASMNGMQVFGGGAAFFGVAYSYSRSSGNNVAVATSDSATTGTNVTKAVAVTDTRSKAHAIVSGSSKSVSKVKSKSESASVKTGNSRKATTSTSADGK